MSALPCDGGEAVAKSPAGVAISKRSAATAAGVEAIELSIGDGANDLSAGSGVTGGEVEAVGCVEAGDVWLCRGTGEVVE